MLQILGDKNRERKLGGGEISEGETPENIIESGGTHVTGNEQDLPAGLTDKDIHSSVVSENGSNQAGLMEIGVTAEPGISDKSSEVSLDELIGKITDGINGDGDVDELTSSAQLPDFESQG